jgi:nucleoside-diphosphate-sugar epimerase
MGSDRATQHRIAVEGTPVIARAARDAGVARLVHVSTAAVYDRSPGVGDVDESSPLVADDANAYAATKRDTDAALAEVDGITRIILRPPAILGAGETSIWNTVRPAEIRRDPKAGHAVPGQTFAWVHVDDPRRARGRGSRRAGVAVGGPETGPVDADCTVVNVRRGRRHRPRLLRDGHHQLSASSRSGTTHPRGPAGS